MSAKLKLKKHKATGSIYHPDSKLIFRSAKDHTVIGRLKGNDVISLDEKAVSLCEKFDLKYDESLLNEEEESEAGTEEEESGDEEDEKETPPPPPAKLQKKAEEEDESGESEDDGDEEKDVKNTDKQSGSFATMLKNMSEYVKNLEKNNAQQLKELNKVKVELKNSEAKLTETKDKFKKAMALFQANL